MRKRPKRNSLEELQQITPVIGFLNNEDWCLDTTSSSKSIRHSFGKLTSLAEGYTGYNSRHDKKNLSTWGNGPVFPETIIHYKNGIPAQLCRYDVHDLARQALDKKILPMLDDKEELYKQYQPLVTYTLPDKKFWKKFKNSQNPQDILDAIQDIENNGLGLKYKESMMDKKSFFSNLKEMISPAPKPQLVRQVGQSVYKTEFHYL